MKNEELQVYHVLKNFKTYLKGQFLIYQFNSHIPVTAGALGQAEAKGLKFHFLETVDTQFLPTSSAVSPRS